MKRKTAIIFASKRNEAKRQRNFFTSMRKKCFFVCFRVWSVTKMKWTENKTKKKRNEKILEAKQSENSSKYALLISLWSEAKRSENKFFFAWAWETDLISLCFALKRTIFFAKPAHPTWWVVYLLLMNKLLKYAPLRESLEKNRKPLRVGDHSTVLYVCPNILHTYHLVTLFFKATVSTTGLRFFFSWLNRPG
jgi:hypothetical protein